MADHLVVPYATRTVTNLTSGSKSRNEGLPLARFRLDPAYVLLGEPGSGKTTEFLREAKATGGKYVPARTFLRETTTSTCAGQTLFIDGLDEVREGVDDYRQPLDAIIAKLNRMGSPHFRLSSRAGSWLGPGDTRALESSIPSDQVAPLLILALDPLSERAVRDILRQSVQENGLSANEFIQRSQAFNLESFLWNPQLLSVLLAAVNANGWPESPTEALEQYCRALAKERNVEHQDARASRSQPSIDQILRAAGKLSALLLLTYQSMWAPTPVGSRNTTLSLEDVHGNDRHALKAALESSLFVGELRQRAPIHRTIAEFLGARFLAESLRPPGPISPRRLLTLLLGHDSVTLPDLRGLTAWLAALCRPLRPALIQADPVSVAFGGDTGTFDSDERAELLEQLETRSGTRLLGATPASAAVLLGTLEKSMVWELLATSARSDNRQTLVLQLLRGLCWRLRHGQASGDPASVTPHGTYRDLLHRTVCDATWMIEIRREALIAFGYILRGSETRNDELRWLVGEIAYGDVQDECNELLGVLLQRLFPRRIGPDEVWEFLAAPPCLNRSNALQDFYNGLDQNTADVVTELIGFLRVRSAEVLPRLAAHRLDGVVPWLLVRLLKAFGDRMSVEQIYGWFELLDVDLNQMYLTIAGAQTRMRSIAFVKGERALRGWMDAWPDKQRALMECGLRLNVDKIGTEALDRTVGFKFLGTGAHENTRRWCLARSAELMDTEPRIAEELAAWAVRSNNGWGPPLSDEEVDQATQGITKLNDWNARRLQANLRWDEQAAEATLNDEVWSLKAVDTAERTRELQRIAPELAQGSCAPAVLDQLANQYLQSRSRLDPNHDLRNWIDGPEHLVTAAVTGFSSIVARNDLPDLRQIAEMDLEHRRSLFARPFLAGLEAMERDGTDTLGVLGPVGRRRALGFYYATPSPIATRESWQPLEDPHPNWFSRALNNYPLAVADALVAVHRARIHRKDSPDRHLLELASEDLYAPIRSIAPVRMLKAYPTRCTQQQVECLNTVLRSALKANDPTRLALRAYLLKRLARSGMDTAQQASWICAGLFLARSEALQALEEYLAVGDNARVRHVAEFFGRHDRDGLPIEDWEAGDLAKLIRLLGSRIGRIERIDQARFLTDKEVAHRMLGPWIHACIEVLAGRVDARAHAALSKLVADPGMRAWIADLKRAQEIQATHIRMDRYTVPSLDEVQRSLDGREPASVADLVALTVDMLEALAKDIRDGDTNDWKQYWDHDVDSRQPAKPKNENDCRDILLSVLRLRIESKGVHAIKEPFYAENKRGDIQMAFGTSLAVPIEVKKTSSRDLWRAAREQLVAKYTRDPKCDGYGIYLVFWFGKSDLKIMPPTGRRPKSAAELKLALESTLPPSVSHRISVTILDVSAANGHGAI